MANDRYISGTPLLMGDNTTPGLKLRPELVALLPEIYDKVRSFGCDFYPTIIQELTYSEMSEIAAYGGFPQRFKHWSFGMEYEELQQNYKYGLQKIYEMVINSSPGLMYLLDSNPLVDHVNVIAHALFHNDFFKNNRFFRHTDRKMISTMANHGLAIERYSREWGAERVREFLDHTMRIQTLIDPVKAWELPQRLTAEGHYEDHKEIRHPIRLKVDDNHEHMEPFINPPDWISDQKKRLKKREVKESLGLIELDEKDIMGFMRDNAPLKFWESDIIAMLHDEAMYFAPQGQTKTLNEGWASRGDYYVMTECGYAGLGQPGPDHGIISYALHKMGVLGGKYSTNPYKLGFDLLRDIENRWNKGQFGREWDQCENLHERKNWDKKLGLGRKKILDVRKDYDDVSALVEFFTPDFCKEYEYFDYHRAANGDVIVKSRDHASIKKKLVNMYVSRGKPDVRIVDDNHRGQGCLFLKHFWEGVPLKDSYTKAVLQSLYFFWKRNVYLSTYNRRNEEIVYCCNGTREGDISVVERSKYQNVFDDSE